MNLEYFIARRSEQDSKNQEPSIMMRVATIAVALGIVVMIITIAVISGFKHQINERLSGLSGDIVVTNVRGVEPSPSIYIEQSEELDSLIGEVGVGRKTSYILRGAIAQGGGVIDGVVVKGVDSLFNAPFFERGLIHGYIPKFAEGSARREVLVSESMAKDLSLEPKGRMEIIFTERDGEINRLTFKVAGVFSLGIGEAERRMIIADIETLRRVNRWGEGQISGYEIYLSDNSNVAQVADVLNKNIIFGADSSLDSVAALSIDEIYPSLFDWLRTHDVNGVVVVTIMMIVALFNMVTALLILVLERTQMIGILKSLGMGNGSLRRIFLYRALGVILRGLVWGNVVAIAICMAQRHWEIMKLESSGYMLSAVPIELGVGWIVALNCGVVVTILAVMVIPTRIVASIKPDEIVKYK